jgi:prepilin-type N-terminal cleavage/methylation domain-containing protein
MLRRPQHSPGLRARRDEGFTLVELLVVMFIVAIMLSVALMSAHNTRATGGSLQAMAVAQTYADSIDRFAREHSGRFPRAPGSPDWAGGANAKRGPMADVLGTIKYYLRQVPEPVQTGSVLVGASSTTAPTINYVSDAAGTSYELVITIPTRAPCVIRDGTKKISATRECSKR